MAALMRLIFMFVLVFMIVVFMVVIMIFVFIIVVVMFMERAFFGVQSLIYDNADCRRASVGMVVMVHLQNQSRFAFLDTF